MKRYKILQNKKDKNKYLYCYTDSDLDIMSLYVKDLPLHELMEHNDLELLSSWAMLIGHSAGRHGNKDTKRLLKQYRKISIKFRLNNGRK